DTIRADHIGSLLRPPALLEEVHRIYNAGHTALLAEERAKDRTRLHELEDEAIRRVVGRQEELGLQVVTDGEFRRLMYFNSFFDAVDGIAPSATKLQFRGDDGSVVEHEGPVAIVGRVSKRDSPAAAEAKFVSSLTDRTVKVTFPTASFLVAQAALGPGIAAYGSTEEAAEPLVAVLRELVDEAIAAGAGYVQFDVSGYMMLSASPLGQLVRSRGIDLDALLGQMLDADRRVVAGLPGHVTTCLHQCRGNYASRYLTDHDGLAELGETFFSLPYDRFTLEWDGHVERTEGDYAALERVPRGGPTVALGVVSTRHAELEARDAVAATIDRAARHIPLEQLAISPQCGFSSALTTGDDGRPDGNLLDEDAQWRKLELLVNTAEKIWG
ncbi:MAG TPA: cobalamin-independent methionine synthase II family protein, partial [Solirubrobacteraceae bacterium]